MVSKTVQMIFKARNDRGEPLIEVAARQGEIWTARAKTHCGEGDRILLKRSGRGKAEYEGIAKLVKLAPWPNMSIFWKQYGLAGFKSRSNWQYVFNRMNNFMLTDDPHDGIYFIHITDIKPYVNPRKRGRSKR